ncbi:hypothetical protein [Variovorax sp. UC74_104]|uniref:hypothetical protein n=1 Tax=Variovorax sp. UC74_104 TaxID=3374555 RepID=UPI003756DCB7
MLRLGVYKLPMAEVVLVRTIVRLSASQPGFAWQLVDAPPYDALLVDNSSAEHEYPGVVGSMAAAVLRLTRMNTGGQPGTMERPIRADRLQQWLCSIEQALREAQPGGLMPHEQTALEVEVSDAEYFMLRRWPPTLLLRNDLDNIRMASLLSRRALNATELSDISQLPFSQCVAFLLELRKAGVLELHVAQALPPVMPRSDKTGGSGDFARSFINGIRRRLGLRVP